jgi:hypothetical protein
MVDGYDPHRGPRTDGDDYFIAHPDTDFTEFSWKGDGTCNDGSEYDIIATISLEAMALAMRLEADGHLKGIDDLVKLADAVLDHADAHCRAFPIATVPHGRNIEIWDSVDSFWLSATIYDICPPDADFTHWREPLPPPSNPPLPAVFVDLGVALEKLKAPHA